jgi:ABC-type Mn2+/Zn2+ transport system permease subunit
MLELEFMRLALAVRAVGIGIGLLSSLTGLVLAYYGDLPPGGAIVLVAAGAFAVCAGVAAVRGPR